MAYTSVEAMLYQWFEERNLYPGKMGRGDIQDLAERVTERMKPFRNFFRAIEGYDGYSIKECRKEAHQAEKE